MTTLIDQIEQAADSSELYDLVEQYLRDIGQYEQARGESYAETANRLGGDEALETAEERWFALGS